MSKNYVYSTLTANVAYVEWKFNPSRDVAHINRRVTIKGGAGVSQRKTFITPKGAVTIVTDEELEILRKNLVFQRHEKKGFIKVEKSITEKPVKKAVKDMKSNDASAPLTPKDFEDIGLNVTKKDGQIVVENPDKK